MSNTLTETNLTETNLMDNLMDAVKYLIQVFGQDPVAHKRTVYECLVPITWAIQTMLEGGPKEGLWAEALSLLCLDLESFSGNKFKEATPAQISANLHKLMINLFLVRSNYAQ